MEQRLAVRVVVVLALAVAAQLAASTSARAAIPAQFGLHSNFGVITLAMAGTPGATAYFDERIGSGFKRVGSMPIGPKGLAVINEAVVWRCDRLVRRFIATAVNPDGTREYGAYDVRTGSCARRFNVVAPSHVAVGKRARVRVFDRWRIGGYRTRLCIKLPKRSRSCRSLAFPRGVSVLGRSFRARTSGRVKIELRVRRSRVRRSVSVGQAGGQTKAPPKVLATGDSTMQGVDSFLADRLASAATVESSLHQGTSISESLEWVTRAAKHAARIRPRTTVISIGAVDSNDMQTPDDQVVTCCGDAWRAEYSRRAVLMMKSYARGGKGRVLWLTLPTPRAALSAAITAQVNRAILAAAAGRPSVRVLRMDQLFSPNGYQEVIRWHGRDVSVRWVDGVHLNLAGTAIAAEAIEQALRDWPGTGISR